MNPTLPPLVACHQCTHLYAGAICPVCKEERPAYAALKRMAEQSRASDHERPYDERTAATLESAVKVLGSTDTVREVVKFVYALGRIDGALALMDKQQKVVA